MFFPPDNLTKDQMDEALVGKTISGWRWVDKDTDPWPGAGIVFLFNDGTEFYVTEYGQAGEITYGLATD